MTTEGERAWQRIAANVAAEHEADLARLKVARAEIARLRAAITSALDDLERRDELSSLDTLRAALGVSQT